MIASAMLLSFFVAVSVVSGISALLSLFWLADRAMESGMSYSKNKPMFRPVTTFILTTFACVFFGVLADTLT